MTQIPNRADRLATEEILRANPTTWRRSSREIGRSRENRPILGVEIGDGAHPVTLIGGCHADEPVGPALLDRLASHLDELPPGHPLTRRYTWRIVPHVNPDGEARNRGWTSRMVEVADHRGAVDRGYDLASYLDSVVRELPGDDIEFGFPSSFSAEAPEIRPENRAVAGFLAEGSSGSTLPISLHGSFHGMGLAPGPWFLTERSWTQRTARLRASLIATAASMGYRLFDAERHGEKGFHRIAPGFSTRPDSRAMREFFEARGEPQEAAKFRASSMEFARANGDDPLTLVPEMPLFLTPSLPPGLVERRELEAVRMALLRAQGAGPRMFEETARELGVVPMPIRDQMRLQLALLDEALQALL